jgi:hypothetical protein
MVRSVDEEKSTDVDEIQSFTCSNTQLLCDEWPDD